MKGRTERQTEQLPFLNIEIILVSSWVLEMQKFM